MTAAAFVDSVQGMKGLLPGMVEHLVSMAPKLTEQERAEAVAALQPVSAEIVQLETEQTAILDNGKKEMAQLKRKKLPAVKKLYEQAEKGKTESDFETQLKNV
jgi:hypothetical protein